MRCDIIIPVWNQLSFTKDCVESIFKNTRGDYRLIIIDNASDDQTRQYLEGLKASHDGRVVLARNEENTGFIKAANKGFGLSDAEYCLVLNNDTIVTDGWLDEMMAVAGSEPKIGIVNPSSNNLGQRPPDGEPIDVFAKILKKDSGRFVELGAAVGFCMLIKREVLKKVGMFDEVFGMGNFEDTDFSRRAVRAGYMCVRACGSYVFHRENTSFRLIRSFDDDFKRNREIYEFRWGRPRRVVYVLDSIDANIMRRVNAEALRFARDGSWIWYFLKEKIGMPVHSNIVPVVFGPAKFGMKAFFKILTKKKKFSDVFVNAGMLGQALERSAFIHKGKVSYY